MSETSPPPRQRRKEARPGEIIAAAQAVFAQNGYGAARMEDVARLAGVSKATLFVYFPNKEELFRAVARNILAGHLERLDAASFPDMPAGLFIPRLLELAAMVGESGVPAIARLIIAESRSFPDLATVWHDEIVSKMLGLITAVIERAQAHGEVRAGNARLFAFSIMGPMLTGAIFREVFGEDGAPDLQALARQHAELVLDGLLAPTSTMRQDKEIAT